MPAKVITEILDKYATAPKSNMQALEDHELSIVFEHLTQNNQISNIAAIYADEPKKPEAPKVEAPKAEAPKAQPTAAQQTAKPAQQPQQRPAQQGQQKLQKWVRRRFAAAGKDIDAGTVDHLLFTCGSLMTGLVPEIAKIAAYARGAKITAADIDAVADPVLDARVFDMTDAVAARDYDKAAECLAELLRMQEEPIRILAALGKTLRQLYTARLAIDGGKDVLWLKDLWRMKSDYPAKKLMQSARGVRRSWCREAVKRCQTLDHRMKSERNMDNEGELKLFLMELAGVK